MKAEDNDEIIFINDVICKYEEEATGHDKEDGNDEENLIERHQQQHNALYAQQQKLKNQLL